MNLVNIGIISKTGLSCQGNKILNKNAHFQYGCAKIPNHRVNAKRIMPEVEKT